MPYPNGTFVDQIADPAVRQEIEQLFSLFQGFLSVQHVEDGSHGDVTATSLAVTGAGTFTGNVTAEVTTAPVLLGKLTQNGALMRALNGLEAFSLDNSTSRWQIGAYNSTSNQRELVVLDRLEANQPYTFRVRRTGALAYAIEPESSIALNLGTNGPGTRINVVSADTMTAATAVTSSGAVTAGYFQAASASEVTLTLNAGNNNDVALTAGTGRVITAPNATTVLTGMTAGVNGQLVVLMNIGNGNALTVSVEDANSQAANRFVPGFTLASGQCGILMYTNRWRMVAKGP